MWEQYLMCCVLALAIILMFKGIETWLGDDK